MSYGPLSLNLSNGGFQIFEATIPSTTNIAAGAVGNFLSSTVIKGLSPEMIIVPTDLSGLDVGLSVIRVWAIPDTANKGYLNVRFKNYTGGNLAHTAGTYTFIAFTPATLMHGAG